MLVALNASASATLSGNGTNDDPYLINTIDELKWMRDQVNKKISNYVSASYKLMSDLDFIAENDWTPIGENYLITFKGTFDGNHKVIRNIKIGSSDKPKIIQNSGFFGGIENANIANLGIEWIGLYTYDSPYFYGVTSSGGVVGYCLGSSVVNCYSIGDIFSSARAGGIAGYSEKSDIINCSSNGNISSNASSSGGVIGLFIDGNIINCYSIGNITSASSSGGIVAYSENGVITNSYSIGDITSSASKNNSTSASSSGGIAGYIANGIITNCSSSGDVFSSSSSSYYTPYNPSSVSSSGGIIGDGKDAIVTNCHFVGEVSSSSSSQYSSYSYSGGIIGNLNGGDILNCISSSKRIVSINSTISGCNVGRIVGCDINISNDNYALSEMTLAIGTFTSQLVSVTDISGSKNGEELKGNPVEMLNIYVDNKKCTNTGHILHSWKLDNEFIIIDLNSPSLNFDLNGCGTINDPYLIYTNDDLLAISAYINTYSIYATKNYKLMSDLDLEVENEWVPIGVNSKSPFKGVFDGNNKIIRNIKIGTKDKPTEFLYAGFFGRVEDAEIKDLGIEWIGLYSYSSYDSYFSSIYPSYAGIIIAYSLNSNISNCFSLGNISATTTTVSAKNVYSYSGGIVGFSEGGDIASCYSAGNVSSLTSTTSDDDSLFSNSGGIAGYCSNVNIINCYSTGDISSSTLCSKISSNSHNSSSYSGGIAGLFEYGEITNCYSSGNISSLLISRYSCFSGGIVGYCDISASINYCLALNASIKSISSYSGKAYSRRIGYYRGNNFSNNFGDIDMIVQTGTSESSLNDVVTIGDGHGENLQDKPVDLLNSWIKTNSSADKTYLTWVVIDDINNGYPVFAELTKLKVFFETFEGDAMDQIQVQYGATIPILVNPAREGYDFDGWYKDAEYTMLWDFDNDLVYANTVLYAKWSIKVYTIIFETNQSSPIDPVQVNHGELLPKPVDPLLEGYIFDGWYKDIDCTLLWDFDNDKIYNDIILYAKWNIAASIEDVDSNGVNIYVIKGHIVVRCAVSDITIYNMAGQVVHIIENPEVTETINVQRDNYIVKCGKKKVKVMVY